MFKKPLVVQNQNLLSKKDVKALKAQLVEEYPGLDEKCLDELLPEGQVKQLKLDNRTILYAPGDSPATFFDAEGRGELFPTLSTLWQHPYMMAELTIHPPVSKFVLNGADLMLPGVIVPANGVAGFGVVKKNQKRCIKIDGNPYPIAVGKMLVSQSQMEKLKGKGLEVCHVFKDMLWDFAGKAVPNAGFQEKDDEIVPCAEKSYVHGAPAPAADAAAAPAPGTPTAGAAAEAAVPATPASPAGAAAPPGAGGGGRPAEDWTQDELLEFCLVKALASSLAEDKALPVEASDLYEKHMKPCRPDGTTLDVKKSSHKQIGKYLNVLRKAKAIDVQEKKNVVHVTKIDRGHKTFTQLQAKFAEDLGRAAAADAEKSETTAAGKGLPPPVLKTLWKATHYTEGLLKAGGHGKNDLITWDEAKGLLAAYVKKEGLGDGDAGTVKLNEELLTALVKASGAQKKDATFPESLEFEELEEKMQDRMQEHTSVEVANGGVTVRKGPPVKIEMTLSRKGAHNVTRISNLEAYGLDVQSMGDQLKKKLNCTVHIEDAPGKNSKDKLLQLQGHVDNEIAEYLVEKYGITKAFMAVHK